MGFIRKWICFLLLLCISSVQAVYGGQASLEEKQRLAEIGRQRQELKKEINSGKGFINSLNQEIKDLEGKIVLATFEMDATEAAIFRINEKIIEAEEELNRLRKSIKSQEKALCARLRAMYKFGSVGFLDVLLGSGSVEDFATNLDWIERIYINDKEFLKRFDTERRQVEEQKKYLLDLRAEHEQSRKEGEQRRVKLDKEKAQLDEKKGLAAQNVDALSELEDSLLAAANSLTVEVLRLQRNALYEGGALIWPVWGKVTSEMGYRIHPSLHTYKLHTGIDIAVPKGTAVVAANGGTVIKAGWNNSYGYMVMVDHGGGIVTLYAHNDKLLVKAGDEVAAGQTVAKSGSTGVSTGPHVHFEVRVDGGYKNPRDYLT